MVILSLCGDPGGAHAISPVLRRLTQENNIVRIYAYRQALEIFEADGLSPVEISEGVQDRELKETLIHCKPDLCLLGTSVNGVDLEKKMILLCRELGITTLSVLDYWSNYINRFTHVGGPALDALPDMVAVMDLMAKDEMIALGIPADRICVTGQPAFDELLSDFDNAEARKKIRKHHQVLDEVPLIVFASQPLTEMKKLGASDLGFDELGVIQILNEAMEEWRRLHHVSAKLWIRPHPRENDLKFSNWVGDDTFVSSDFTRNEVVAAADLIVGMNSIFLIEACLLGGTVLSLQPGGKRSDDFPFQRLGLGTVCYDDQVLKVLTPLIRSKKLAEIVPEKLKANYGGGAGNVLKLIKKLAEAASR